MPTPQDYYTQSGELVTFDPATKQYSNVVPSTPTKAVGMFSSSSGAELLNGQSQKLDTAITTRTANGTSRTTTPAPAPTKSTTTFIDPTTGAEMTGATRDQANNGGLVVSGGEVPDWYLQNPITQQYMEAFQQSSEQMDSLIGQLDMIKASSDATYNQSISAIQGQFNARRDEMQEINRRRTDTLKTLGTRSGGERYTASFGGLVTEEERAGVRRLSELDSEEATAIAAAKLARDQENWKVFDAKMKIVDSVQTRKIQTLDKLYDAVNTYNEKIATEAKAEREAAAKKEEQFQKDKNQVLSDATKNGLIDPQKISAIGNAASLTEAISIAGDYLQSSTGELGDYLVIRRQARENGKTIPDYQTWQKNMEQEKLNTEIAKLKATEGIKFNYSLALEKAKKQIETQADPDYRGEFEATIKLASGSGGTQAERQGIKSNLQEFIASGDYNSAYTQIVSSVQQKLKGSPSSKFSEQLIAKNVLSDLTDAIKNYAALGGNTNIFKGKADDIQTKIGVLATDPKFASIATQLDSAFQAYRQQMTGAAFGVQESAEYESVLPSKDNTLDLNLAKMQGANAYLDSAINGALKNTVGIGGIYIKERAEASIRSINEVQNTENKIVDFVNQSNENRERYDELKQIAPDATIEEIAQELGL